MKKTINKGAFVLTLSWGVIFLTPLMFINISQEFVLKRFLVELAIPLSLFVVFFANYYWLTPKVLMEGRQLRYIALNVALVVAIALLVHEWVVFSYHTWFSEMFDVAPPATSYQFNRLDVRWSFFYIARDIFNMAVSGTVATAIVLSRNWAIAKNRQAEAESERVKMELMMLRYQVNPHFLLNTLNNIYALTAFDQIRAQKSIQQLSQLMRHILYLSDEDVRLTDEVVFLNSYIELMQLRVTDKMTLTKDIDISSDPNKLIPPLLFIPLVENAFKHGVSTTQESFIDIRLKADSEKVECVITNSNHPKDDNDHSGSGIGLEQVRRRLSLVKSGHYEWTQGVSADKTTYHSKIILYDS